MKPITLITLLHLLSHVAGFNGAFFFPSGKLRESALSKSQRIKGDQNIFPKDYLSSLSSNKPVTPSNNQRKRTKHFVTNSYLDNIDHPKSSVPQTTRQSSKQGVKKEFSIVNLGLNTMMAYLFISNACGCICFSRAWFLASQKTGLSPFAPGQWQTFGPMYASFFVFLKLIRPARVAAAVVVSGLWGNMISSFQTRFKVNKTTAIAMVLVVVNVCGGIAIMGAGVALASVLSEVPVYARL